MKTSCLDGHGKYVGNEPNRKCMQLTRFINAKSANTNNTTEQFQHVTWGEFYLHCFRWFYSSTQWKLPFLPRTLSLLGSNSSLLAGSKVIWMKYHVISRGSISERGWSMEIFKYKAGDSKPIYSLQTD